MAITYSIDGGADAAKFNINATSGALTFKVAPDFENPGDSNKDNIYEVSVKATDAGGLASSKLVKVTVTDVSEGSPPQITSAGAVTVKENATAVMTITATDPDDGGTTEPPPVQTGWPDASNTGVPAGTTLTNYTGPTTITVAGTTIDSKTINSELAIQAANVTIRKCRLTSTGYWGVRSDSHAFTVIDSEISGALNSAIACDKGGTFTRLNIHDADNGMQVGGTGTITDCYIWGLKNGPEAHPDAVAMQGGTNGMNIQHCTIIGAGNAAVYVNNDWGNNNDITVNNCQLLTVDGGDKAVYTVFVDQKTAKSGKITNVRFTNNKVKRGYYDYKVATLDGPWVWTGNVDHATGASRRLRR